jgi:transcriptional regulator with XRE-family HTH domain
MDHGFGARLRAQRERRQLDLTAIAAETKIKESLLEALERDDVTYWPSGIFRRAWLRSYARAIGLDPEPIVREFLELYPDPEEVLAAEQEAERAKPTGLRKLVGAAVPGFLRRAQPAAPPALASIPLAADPIDYANYSESDFEVIGLHRQPRAATAAGGTRGVTEVATVAAVGDAAPTPESPAAPQQLPSSPDSHSALQPHQLHLPELATLCGRIARAEGWRQAAPLLAEAARLLDSDGLVLWAWRPDEGTLRACAGHGYADAMLARLPGVREDEANAIAQAFRSGSTAIVSGGDATTGALAVPLTSPAGTLGVLALEFRDGREQQPAIRAAAEIVAAQFARL